MLLPVLKRELMLTTNDILQLLTYYHKISDLSNILQCRSIFPLSAGTILKHVAHAKRFTRLKHIICCSPSGLQNFLGFDYQPLLLRAEVQ